MGFNYGEMMKQAKMMQKQMEKVQEELKEAWAQEPLDMDVYRKRLELKAGL